MSGNSEAALLYEERVQYVSLTPMFNYRIF